MDYILPNPETRCRLDHQSQSLGSTTQFSGNNLPGQRVETGHGAMDTTSDLEIIDEPSQVMTDAIQSAEAYRRSTLLILCRTIPELPSCHHTFKVDHSHRAQTLFYESVPRYKVVD
jgi:hypothetical protein